MGIVGTFVLAALCAAMVVKERAFCEYLCPLGAVFALLPQLPSARMKRDMGACTECATCQRTCPVSIYPPDDGPQMGECIGCGRCEHACPASCVSQGGKRRTAAAFLLRSVLLAVLLLALLWAVGSVNFLPTPQDLLVPAE